MTTPLLPDSPGGPTEDLQQHENVAFEAQSGGNRESSSTGSKKRDREPFFTGESSTSELPKEPSKKRKTHKEFIKHRSVGKSAKALRKRIGKRTVSVMDMLRDLHLIYEQMPWLQNSELLKIVQEPEAELKTIKKYIDQIEDDAKQGVLTEPNAKKKLIKAERKLNKLKEGMQKARNRLNEFSQEMKKLNTIFTDSMKHSPEYLREELSSVFPNGIEELDHIGVNQNQVHGSLPTPDDLHSKLVHIGINQNQVHASSTLDDLLSKLYDKDNNKVDFPDFEGLQEALDKVHWGETPGYLKCTAVEIETAIGKRIEIPHIRVLLSAAIKEMKDLKVEELEGDMFKMFKKWVATLNYAKEEGFDVEFAYNKLEKYVRAYLAYRENREGKGSGCESKGTLQLQKNLCS